MQVDDISIFFKDAFIKPAGPKGLRAALGLLLADGTPTVVGGKTF